MQFIDKVDAHADGDQTGNQRQGFLEVFRNKAIQRGAGQRTDEKRAATDKYTYCHHLFSLIKTGPEYSGPEVCL